MGSIKGEYAPGSPLAALFAHYGASGTEFGVDRRIDPMLRASLFCRSAGILFLNPAATSSRLKYSGFANKILDATRMRKGLYQRGVEPSADAWCATCISE
jgi:hypothetical protein